MNREALEHAKELKRSMQAAIDSGDIESREQLLDLAAGHGLTVTRNGRDYAGFLCESGKRLRVHFEFNDRPPRQPKPPKQPKPRKITTGIWIYALLAHSKDGKRKACYVGQAADLRKRFRDHLHRPREGRGSFALFQWAAHEQVDIQAVGLTWVAKTQSNATYFEGYWLQRALQAGFEAPDVHNWGRLPKPGSLPGQPTHWPVAEVQASALSLVEVVMQKLTPKVLYVGAESIAEFQIAASAWA
ncbi:GIY-YIG nuclease family protein [Pseudomonas gingeri]|uniref:GIY-YIG nuclease family protein n=1 Tax=Pseudomonas gingeri TaxID=117681 RepID=A0A7Y8C4U4_9PSED|nr:GIY-YIG nuclease family protein [Pseudomonas gingeri]NWB99543.1 GIY-YIG nuclease family protein [Pseudomonas gingeri]